MLSQLILKLSVGASPDLASAALLKHGNDNPSREQQLFEACVGRELVDDLEGGA